MEILKNPKKTKRRPGRGQKRPGRGQKRLGRGQEKAREKRPQKARNPEFGEKLLETQCFINRK